MFCAMPVRSGRAPRRRGGRAGGGARHRGRDVASRRRRRAILRTTRAAPARARTRVRAPGDSARCGRRLIRPGREGSGRVVVVMDQEGRRKGDGGGGLTRAGVRRGARAALAISLGLMPFGLVVGAVSDAKGLSLLETWLMAGLVFAGTSQLVALELWS